MKLNGRSSNGYILIFLIGLISTSCKDHEAIIDGEKDLAISFIQRLPEIDYVWGSEKPNIQGWPGEGDPIIWRAHIRNWSGSSREGVSYKWYLNDHEQLSGRVDIKANSEITVDFPSRWGFKRQVLTFEIDDQYTSGEKIRTNNILSVYTDALSIGFYVEDGFYDQYKGKWDDWLQQEINRLNIMCEKAIYPESPKGVLDRFRIDKITRVPNQSISSPLKPNADDRTVDIQWGFPWNDAFDFASVLAGDTKISTMHELGHARYLIDVYGFDVTHGIKGDDIAIMEGGESIVGSYLKSLGEVTYISESGTKRGVTMYKTPFRGFMHTTNWVDHSYIGKYSAVALNLVAGHRATVGNYNGPENMGVFLNDLPDENILKIRDVRGNTLENAEIKVYQSVPNAGGPDFSYGKFFDNNPDLTFFTDENGHVNVGRNPFSKTGPIVHSPRGGSNVIAIIRVAYQGKVGYSFLEVAQFNMAYWRGENTQTTYDMIVDLIEN